MNDWIEIGVFAVGQKKGKGIAVHFIYKSSVIRTGPQHFKSLQ
jgi:hypothetical protein